MGTPMEDAAYQQALESYRVWCEAVGQMPDPAYLDQLAAAYNQLPAGMVPSTPQVPGAGAPAVPGAGAPAVPGGAAPQPTGSNPAAGEWDIEALLRQSDPSLSDEEIAVLVPYVEQFGLDYVQGSAFIIELIRSGTEKYISDNLKEVGLMNAESNRISADAAAQNAETNRLYSLGMLEEAGLSRKQELLISRELNELNKYIAEMQNQVSTLGLQISERAYGAQLGAHPVNTVEFELWKRAGGSLEPVEIPEAPVPQEPVVPGATATQGVPTAPTVPGAQRGLEVFSPKGRVPVGTASPGELHTTGEEGWEYLRPGPGTVVAPRAKGETRPTQEGGQQAINRQLGHRGGGRFRSPYAEPHAGGPYRQPTSVQAYKPPTSGGGKRVPYGWMKRRQALGFQGEVPGAQGGYVDPGTHTDEEMAAAFASAMKGWPALYNPGLTGRGQFGERIPSPGQVGRRQYYSMDPSGHEMLKSHLASGFMTPEYGQIGGESLVMDWLRQMQRSWIPGLEGAKKAVSYAY